ncbi:hypothetical protein DERF_002707 [Dermatophagoides farinae]|uniref:Uncharacterized protein n=1 Tax=Dermatophagoides farinae TaxID=6954 RepID=A0A922IDE9_DERFA|nr:hypothetical protein DERF_002707 [Dermatophagoides farinae]
MYGINISQIQLASKSPSRTTTIEATDNDIYQHSARILLEPYLEQFNWMANWSQSSINNKQQQVKNEQKTKCGQAV